MLAADLLPGRHVAASHLVRSDAAESFECSIMHWAVLICPIERCWQAGQAAVLKGSQHMPSCHQPLQGNMLSLCQSHLLAAELSGRTAACMQKTGFVGRHAALLQQGPHLEAEAADS